LVSRTPLLMTAEVHRPASAERACRLTDGSRPAGTNRRLRDHRGIDWIDACCPHSRSRHACSTRASEAAFSSRTRATANTTRPIDSAMQRVRSCTRYNSGLTSGNSLLFAADESPHRCHRATPSHKVSTFTITIMRAIREAIILDTWQISQRVAPRRYVAGPILNSSLPYTSKKAFFSRARCKPQKVESQQENRRVRKRELTAPLERWYSLLPVSWHRPRFVSNGAPNQEKL